MPAEENLSPAALMTAKGFVSSADTERPWGAPVGVIRPRLRHSAPLVEGLTRSRLLRRLDQLLDARLGIIVAPAGAGKTTLMAQWAAQTPFDVVWYRADSPDRSEDAVVNRFGGALGPISAGHPPARDLQSLLAAIARHHSPLVLVIDDLHLVEHTRVADQLQRLALAGPAHLRLLVASRRTPGLNLARIEVPTVLVREEELRFRAAETAALFRMTYGRPLTPPTAELLTRQTDGWAAGLHLFQLGLPAGAGSDRRLELAGPDARYARGYLDAQVLANLPDPMVEFLRATSCFERLTADRCDHLLEKRHSRQLLARLWRGCDMVRSADGGFSYQVHGLLRRHLETELLDSMSPSASLQHYRKAATILCLEQEYAAAARVLARSSDWKALKDLLGRHGAAILSATTEWVDWIPEAEASGDPWILLARARRRLDHGEFGAASYEADAALQQICDERLRRLAVRTREVAALWAGKRSDASGWSAIVRRALTSRPSDAADTATELARTTGPEALLAAGIAQALAGDLRRARCTLRRCTRELTDERTLMVARLALAAVSDDGGGAVEALLGDDTLAAYPWLCQVAQAVASAHHVTRYPTDLEGNMLLDEIEESDFRGDTWGALTLAAVRAIALLRADRGEGPLEELVARAHALGLSTLEAWARSAGALAAVTAGLPDAAREAQAAEAFARAADVPGALAISYAALAAEASDGGLDLVALAETTADHAGFDVSPWRWPSAPPVAGQPAAPSAVRGLPSQAPRRAAPTAIVTNDPPPISVHCFGGFRLYIGGDEAQLRRVRPRARAVLRLLALESGHGVHREVLLDALWRDVDPAAGTHSLHVSVSSLRAALEPGVSRGASKILVRDGEHYRLAMPPGSFSDLVEFDRAVTEADACRSSGDTEGAARALHRAMSLAVGQVLAEDGPADWVVGVRERYRVRVAEAAATLGEFHLARHDPASAAAAALHSLDVDPCRDASWRLLVSAYLSAGDVAAAERARRSYAKVLTSLGIGSDSAVTLPRPRLRPPG